MMVRGYSLAFLDASYVNYWNFTVQTRKSTRQSSRKLEAAGKTEHAYEAIFNFLHASGFKLEVKIPMQLLWIKPKGGHISEGGRIFKKLRY